MNASAPVIPEHIYTQSIDPNSGKSRLVISPDRLIAWCEEEHGNSVERWCDQVCEQKIDAINAWMDDRILELEDEWAASENTVIDEDEDEGTQRFHRACAVVAREAEQKSNAARAQVPEHRAAIAALLQQARKYRAAHTLPAQEGGFAGAMILLAGVAALAYVLLT